jgi:hypothetical protein
MVTASGKENNDLTVILKTKSQIYAEMVKEALEQEGITVILKSTMGHHLRGMLPFAQDFFNYSLYIQKEHADAAEEIVNTIVPDEEIL